MKLRSAGFSLLELMAVIMIIGLAIGGAAVMVNTNSPEYQVVEGVEKFMAIAEFASEKATLSGDSVGLRLEPPEWQTEDSSEYEDMGWRYHWVLMSYQGWVEIPNMPPVSFPPGVELKIEVGEIEWNWEEALDRETPLAVYYPSGDISDIAIEITSEYDEEIEAHIELDDYGQLVWRELQEEREAREKEGR